MDALSSGHGLLDELAAQIAATTDRAARARLRIEEAIAAEGLGERARARQAYAAAAEDAPDLFAAVHGRRRAEGTREAIDEELRIAPDDARADLLVARARALGDDDPEALASLRQALEIDPAHAGALAALDAALVARGDDESRMRLHARLARVHASDRRLAASHLAARARIAERLGDDATAQDGYEEAILAWDEEGLARDGLRRVLARRGGWARLRTILIEDADRAKDATSRVVALHEAARISADRLDDGATAVDLLRRAHEAGPSQPALDARVVEDLVRALEDEGDVLGAARARRARIEHEAEPVVRALEERRLAADLEVLGDPSGAVSALFAARAIEPLDDLGLATLDRLLATLGRDEERIALWLEEARRPGDPARSARAQVRAASVADGALGRGDDALRILRAAWATRPGDEDALDGALRLLLASRAVVDPERVRAAVDMLVHAAELATEPALRIAHLEKAAALAEEIELPRAIELHERVLALSPTRRLALVSLQRVLRRAGEVGRLAIVIEREAEQSSDVDHAIALRLRAAAIHRDEANAADRALSSIRRVLEARPDHEAALESLVTTLEVLGRGEELRDALERLLVVRERRHESTRADVTPLRLAIAEVSARRLGKLDDAIDTWRQVLANDPRHPTARRDLARALRASGRAREAGEAMLAIDPVLAGLIFEHRARDDEAARGAYLRAPDDPEGRRGLLRVADRMRDPATLERVLEGDPLRLGELLIRLDRDHERAADALDAAPGDDVDTLRLRVEAARRVGRDERALDALTRLAATTTDDGARRAALAAIASARPSLATARAWVGAAPGDRSALELLDALADHEGALDARIDALRARRALAVDPFDDLRLAGALEARADDGEAAAAVELHRAWLGCDPRSPTAISALLRLAPAIGDRDALLAAHRSAAEIASDGATRVRHLLAAATLARDGARAPDGPADLATTLVEAALATDPDSEEAATAAAQHLVGRDPRKLLDLLARATFSAKRPERIIALGREAAALADALPDGGGRACALLDRARAVDPRNVAVLVEHGEALRKEGAFAEAVRALEDALASGSESTHRALLVRARRALVELFEGPLADPLRTIVELRAIVRLEPSDVAARRRLAAVLGRQGQPIESDMILSGLAADAALPVEERLSILDQLAALRLAHHDRAGGELALRESVRLDPTLTSASWRKLEAWHHEHLRGDESLADTLNELVVDPRSDPSWLLELAKIELRIGRERGAIMHLRMAAKMQPDAVEALVALASALLAVAEFDEAGTILHRLALRDPTDARVLAAWERALVGTHANEEALVVAELRAWLGQHEESGRFRARAPHDLSTGIPREGVLDEVAIAQWIAPRQAPAAAIEVLHVLAPLAGKIATASSPASYGVSPRDKLTAKSGHPLKLVVDRLAAVVGLPRVDVWIHELRDRGVGVEALDPPAIFVPSWLLALPEIEVRFGVARGLARLALGAHLIDALGAEGAVEAIGAAVSGGADEVARKVQRALPRDARRKLETLAGELPELEPAAFARAIEQTAVRIAYLLVGDLGSALTHVRRGERIHVDDVGREGTTTGDLIRFATTNHAIALRSRLGTTWARTSIGE